MRIIYILLLFALCACNWMIPSSVSYGIARTEYDYLGGYYDGAGRHFLGSQEGDSTTLFMAVSHDIGAHRPMPQEDRDWLRQFGETYLKPIAQRPPVEVKVNPTPIVVTPTAKVDVHPQAPKVEVNVSPTPVVINPSSVVVKVPTQPVPKIEVHPSPTPVVVPVPTVEVRVDGKSFDAAWETQFKKHAAQFKEHMDEQDSVLLRFVEWYATANLLVQSSILLVLLGIFAVVILYRRYLWGILRNLAYIVARRAPPNGNKLGKKD